MELSGWLVDPPSTFVNYIHPQKSSTKKTRPQFQKAVFQVIAWGCVSKLGDAHTSSSFFGLMPTVGKQWDLKARLLLCNPQVLQHQVRQKTSCEGFLHVSFYSLLQSFSNEVVFRVSCS